MPTGENRPRCYLCGRVHPNPKVESCHVTVWVCRSCRVAAGRPDRHRGRVGAPRPDESDHEAACLDLEDIIGIIERLRD